MSITVANNGQTRCMTCKFVHGLNHALPFALENTHRVQIPTKLHVSKVAVATRYPRCHAPRSTKTSCMPGGPGGQHLANPKLVFGPIISQYDRQSFVSGRLPGGFSNRFPDYRAPQTVALKCFECFPAGNPIRQPPGTDFPVKNLF